MLAEHLQAGFVAGRFSTTWTQLVLGRFGPIIPTQIFRIILFNKFHYWFGSQISLHNSRDKQCGENTGQWRVQAKSGVRARLIAVKENCCGLNQCQ